jgi:hypothetical protein
MQQDANEIFDGSIFWRQLFESKLCRNAKSDCVIGHVNEPLAERQPIMVKKIFIYFIFKRQRNGILKTGK